MEDLAQAAQTIGKLLNSFIASSGLRLRYQIKVRTGRPAEEPADAAGTATPAAAGEDARTLFVDFSGPDTAALTTRNGEVLNALEHIALKCLRMEPETHERICFDADRFKADRDRRLRESASAAIERVRNTGQPHPFPAMSSRERRMLHMLLSESGLPTASSGEGPNRFVVLYPAGYDLSRGGYEAPPPRRRGSGHMRDDYRRR